MGAPVIFTYEEIQLVHMVARSMSAMEVSARVTGDMEMAAAMKAYFQHQGKMLWIIARKMQEVG